jgi:P27 family predicted phage terminase small subunit
MKIVSVNIGKDTLMKCPNPPLYLSESAKKHFRKMGGILASNQKLKTIHLNALEVYADSMDQFEWAANAMKVRNKKEPGSGYIQVFKTGAKNISVELTIKNDSINKLMKCFSIFGLDPKSEKELKDSANPNQTSLFEELMKIKNG